MTVRELIKKMEDETYENEKDYELFLIDRDTKQKYRIGYYDWCDTNIVIDKVDE